MNLFKWILLRMPKEAFLLFSFLGLILLGTALLCLPGATRAGSIPFLDALFTATSAACVTGLIVVDTGTAFTLFGQMVVLGLIQLGGLGMITISSFFAVLLGKRIPLKQREIVRQTHSSIDTKSFLSLVKRIVVFTLVIEGGATILLLLAWGGNFSFLQAVWVSVFHSVSAFCNAGFSLFSDSLIGHQTSYVVNLTVMALIFLGSIGFLVIYDVERRLLFGMELSLHSRIALRTTVFLLLLAAIVFYLLEADNVLRGLSVSEKILVSLFQSMTPRTAGFNTVAIERLTNPTLILLLLLMFIGGSPGSTAGGIKTTTFAVFLATGYNRFKGSAHTNLLRRTVPERVANEAISIILISVGILLFFNFFLQLTEAGTLPHPAAAGSFMETNFEAVSAFGTVGLSTGLTPALSPLGKVQIILLMFIGRVGPLAIAVTTGRRHRMRADLQYYSENVMVG